MNWHVDPDKALQLNIRVAPRPGALLASLPAETNIIKISENPTRPEWWEVDANLNGSLIRGYVNSTYLKSGDAADISPEIAGSFPEAHLRDTGRKRSMTAGRAFPLGEADMPSRPTKAGAELIAIIDYLRPDKPTHLRYQPGGGNTYCNIYAYDFACCCGVYLPRVWWADKAVSEILAGNSVDVVYGKTVRELNANMLHDWFIDYGAGFGWRRVFTAGEMQGAANGGSVCIIVAKRLNVSRSGHINAVVPEHGGLVAATADGEITRPVQSQAGSANFTKKIPARRWWASTNFQSFGFWICD